jgi:hypothetical protein
MTEYEGNDSPQNKGIAAPDETESPKVETADHPSHDGTDQAPQTEEEIMKPVTFKDACFGIRGDIELLKAKVWNMRTHPGHAEAPSKREAGEMKANIMLAYRHLEDARMRIGKVVQAYDGGKSVYPK